MRKKILITGGAGFLGANLAKKFAGLDIDAEVFLADNFDNNWRLSAKELEGFKIVDVDLADEKQAVEKMRKVEPDVVFNLAAAGVSGSDDDWSGLVQNNINIVLNVMKAVSESKPSRFVQMGTCFEYGSSDEDMSETDTLNPKTVYSASKVATTYTALTVGRKLQIPVSILRAFTLYGPWDNPFRLVPWVILSILNGGGVIKLTEGKDTQVKDFLHVDDLVDVLVQVGSMEDEQIDYEIINIGHNETVSVKELVEKIAKLMEVDVKIEIVSPKEMPFASRKTEYQRVVADIAKASKLLDYSPSLTLDKGLDKTIKWFRKNKDLYRYEE